MELRVNEVQLPEQILFNYEELKQELTEKVSHYETLVYTDSQIKEAKADKANLNKLKKALNDERIRREKEYMQPFNDFKAKINEIISIIDKPVAVIDKQVKEYEEKQKAEKKQKIYDFWREQTTLSHVQFEQIFNEKWLNASASMKSIQEEIVARLEQIEKDLATLSNLPEFGFEATEVYKSTLDVNKAITEAKRMSDMQKAKAQHEAEMKARAEEEARLATEAEAKKQFEEPKMEELPMDFNRENEIVENPTVIEPTKQWVSFSALLSVADAQALAGFFATRGIEYKRV